MNKKTYIEFIRIAACFLVIVNHTNSRVFLNSTPRSGWFCSVAYFFVSKIAVPLFLFIMGALLLNKEDSPKKTFKRVVRISVILVIGSFAYSLYYPWKYGSAFSFKQLLLDFPAADITTAFWYLYLYIALLLMLPILQTLVKALSRRQMEYLLFLSLVVLGTIPLIPHLEVTPYFTGGLLGTYIGQVILGYYIEHYVPMTKKVFWGCLCGFIVLIICQVARTYSLYLKNPASYLSLDNIALSPITGSAACFYICVKYLFTKHPAPPKLARGIHGLGALTFGIYLLGDMVNCQSVSVYPALQAHMHPLAAVVLWELFIFIVCALITAVLRLIPPLRKWI